MLQAKWKIIITVTYIIILFLIKSWIEYGIIFACLIVTCFIVNMTFYEVMRFLKRIIPIIVFTAVINMFFIDGRVIFSWNFIRVSAEGIEFAIKMVIRVIFLLLGSSILTYTTTPFELAYGIETLMKPLNKLNFPVHEFSMVMTISLRFIPILEEEINKIIEAQKSRGAKIDSKNIIKKVKALNSVIIPLLVSVLRRSEQIAISMESRCYNNSEAIV